MGKPVTVDSADLERLLFATSAIKGIETALQSAKQDPFVQASVSHGFTEAHDRVATAWRNATREAPGIDHDVALSREGEQLIEVISLSELETKDIAKFGELRRKGMIDVAPRYAATYWGGNDKPHLRDSGKFVVRLTTRGRDVHAKLDYRVLPLGEQQRNRDKLIRTLLPSQFEPTREQLQHAI